MKALIVWVVVALMAAGCSRRDDHSMTPLMRASAAGDTTEIRKILRWHPRSIDAEVKPVNSLRAMIAFIAWMQDLPDRQPGYTALMFAVQGGHQRAAHMLLEKGADPNHNANGITVVELAVFKNDAPMVALLARNGLTMAPAQGHLMAPFGFAAMRGDTALLRALLVIGARVNEPDRTGITPLMAAARAGQADAVRLLVRAGADPNARDANGWTAGRWALERGHPNIGALLPQDAKNAARQAANHELFAAVSAFDVAAVRAALAKGADVNAASVRGRSVLTVAAGHKDTPGGVIDALLDAGARITPLEAEPMLYVATVTGNERLFDLALQAGARPEDRLFVEAARTNQPAMMERLLARGMVADMQQGEPMRAAARYGAVDAVRLLLSRKASFDLANGSGTTAFGEACTRGRTEIAELMVAAGADRNQCDALKKGKSPAAPTKR